MEEDYTLKLEIPSAFKGCFIEAVETCVKAGYEFEIKKMELIPFNCWKFEVEAVYANDFFYLGKRYAQLRSKL